MASLEQRTRDGQLRWYARHRDPAGEELVKVFHRKVGAERFLTTTEGREAERQLHRRQARLDQLPRCRRGALGRALTEPGGRHHPA